MRRNSRFAAFGIALALVSLLAASGSEAQGIKAPAISTEMADRAAEIVYSREVNRARAARTLDTNRALLTTALRMSTPLIAYAATFAPVAASWSWVVHVETREDPIAWCLPGGKIMLSSGLVDRARLTPPEIAVVLAHVIAHALAGHDAAMAAARLADLRDTTDPNRRILQLADILGKIVQSEPHDMETERATDASALEFMARAAVDPRPTAEAWRKILRAGGATPPGFLALHPSWPGRIEEIEAQLPPILPLYEQALVEMAARPQQPPIRGYRPGMN